MILSFIRIKTEYMKKKEVIPLDRRMDERAV